MQKHHATPIDHPGPTDVQQQWQTPPSIWSLPLVKDQRINAQGPETVVRLSARRRKETRGQHTRLKTDLGGGGKQKLLHHLNHVFRFWS